MSTDAVQADLSKSHRAAAVYLIAEQERLRDVFVMKNVALFVVILLNILDKTR